VIELPLVLVGGLLGSSHCVGMCGGFALSIGSGANSLGSNLRRQVTYSIGRIFTYACLGAIAGFGGMRLAQFASQGAPIAAILAAVAGVFLVYQGLQSAGVWKKGGVLGTHGPCLTGKFLATFLTTPGFIGPFLAGVFTGFLPCGLLYGMLALAATSQDLLFGALVMTVFGLGTVPVMVATGASSGLLSIAARRHMLRVAAWCVVITGVVTLARGASYLAAWTSGGSEGCPLCG